MDIVLSLLTPEEEGDLDLRSEAREAEAQGIKFLSFPIPDRQVPCSEVDVTEALEKLDADLSAGKGVVVHCRQGIGWAGMIAACLLVAKGMTPDEATQSLSKERGVRIPETEAQRRWIERYAATLALKA